jgi:hypothetical protein
MALASTPHLNDWPGSVEKIAAKHEIELQTRPNTTRNNETIQ